MEAELGRRVAIAAWLESGPTRFAYVCWLAERAVTVERDMTVKDLRESCPKTLWHREEMGRLLREYDEAYEWKRAMSLADGTIGWTAERYEA